MVNESTMVEKSRDSLLVDLAQGVGIVETKIDLVLASQQRSAEQLADTSERVAVLEAKFQGHTDHERRLRDLERQSDMATGVLWGLRAAWLLAAGAVGAFATFILHKLGLRP